MSCRNQYEQEIWDQHHMSMAKFAKIRNRWQCGTCKRWFKYMFKHKGEREFSEERKSYDGWDPWIGQCIDMCPKCLHELNTSPMWPWSMKDLER